MGNFEEVVKNVKNFKQTNNVFYSNKTLRLTFATYLSDLHIPLYQNSIKQHHDIDDK